MWKRRVPTACNKYDVNEKLKHNCHTLGLRVVPHNLKRRTQPGGNVLGVAGLLPPRTQKTRLCSARFSRYQSSRYCLQKVSSKRPLSDDAAGDSEKEGGESDTESGGDDSNNGSGGEPPSGGGNGDENGDSSPEPSGEGSGSPSIQFALHTFSYPVRALKRLYTYLIELPPGVLTPFLMATCSLSAALLSVWSQQRSAEKVARERAESEEQKKLESIQRSRQQHLARFTEPLLITANQLQRRLYDLATRGSEGQAWLPHEDSARGLLYSVYLLGRYLGIRRILLQESPSFNYGRPIEDRLYKTILKRIDFMLTASSAELERMHQIPTTDTAPESTGDLAASRGRSPFQLTQYEVTSMGELMRRQRWDGQTSQYGKPSSSGVGSGDAVLAFPDFQELLSERAGNNTVQSWFEPACAAFAGLPSSRSGVAEAQAGHMHSSWARIAMLQSALLDLIDLIDPLHSTVQAHERLRLYHYPAGHTPMPAVLRYLDANEVRDGCYGKFTSGIPGALRWLRNTGKLEAILGARTCRLPSQAGVDHNNVVTVFVKKVAVGTRSVGGKGQTVPNCPYCQKVLIHLEKMGKPYVLVEIDLKNKPWWYLNLNPTGRVPSIFHKGRLTEDSSAICDFLEARETFSTSTVLDCSATKPSSHDFFQSFMQAVYSKSEEDTARYTAELMEGIRELDAELRDNCKPFFGGRNIARLDMERYPQLLHVEMAGEVLMNARIPDECTALRKYMARMSEHPSVKVTVPSQESIVAGWKEAWVDENQQSSLASFWIRR
ncbi:Glutathione S-transferase dhar1, mitochondrial [Cymbomonas tetramitiformis]|uniref:Glutathione S-transferase dhar1, mitochondrial n=1 Tax=Cymbomonas tetramitiformis TaxID=36881 RepID=A0AAE0LHW1_9CHLO|nr:Glutathione S-transferase dhar1, mitochondrial [Cymbomonas tetramitiformis]